MYAPAASREAVGGASMGTASSKVKPFGKHNRVLAAPASFRASVDPTAGPTARSDSNGPSLPPPDLT